jgi:hypothetical protein
MQDMACSRKHDKWHLIKLVGKRAKFCDYIIGYRQSEGKSNSVLMCGDLAKGKKMPKGYVSVDPNVYM